MEAAMNRYIDNQTNVFNRFDGKRAFRTTRYPKIPVDYNDLYIIAGDTDYLDTLADKYYQDNTLWWVIAQANGIKASHKAPTGMQIRIPQNVQNILAEFRRENRM